MIRQQPNELLDRIRLAIDGNSAAAATMPQLRHLVRMTLEGRGDPAPQSFVDAAIDQWLDEGAPEPPEGDPWCWACGDPLIVTEPGPAPDITLAGAVLHCTRCDIVLGASWTTDWERRQNLGLRATLPSAARGLSLRPQAP